MENNGTWGRLVFWNITEDHHSEATDYRYSMTGQLQTSFFFLGKHFERTKTHDKQKPTNKTKSLVWNCPNDLIYYTTDVYPYRTTYLGFAITHLAKKN